MRLKAAQGRSIPGCDLQINDTFNGPSAGDCQVLNFVDHVTTNA